MCFQGTRYEGETRNHFLALPGYVLDREIIEPSDSTEKLIAGNELLAAHLEKYSQEERQKNESIANAFRLVLDYAQSVTGKPREALFLEMAEFLTRYTGNLAEGLVAYCKSLGNPENL